MAEAAKTGGGGGGAGGGGATSGVAVGADGAADGVLDVAADLWLHGCQASATRSVRVLRQQRPDPERDRTDRGGFLHGGPSPRLHDDVAEPVGALLIDTQQTMDAYFRDLLNRDDYSRHYSDDVVVEVRGTDQRYQGREAAKNWVEGIHAVGEIKVRNTLLGETHAVAEAELVRKDGISVPYSVIYDVAAGKITSAALLHSRYTFLIRTLLPVPAPV
jgi:hypothetical protein